MAWYDHEELKAPEDYKNPTSVDWDQRFLKLADHVASWSKDPSTKVGCVLVRGDRTVSSMGYNGFPRGVTDDEERLSNRDLKYLLVQHAEANAVSSASESLQGHSAYVTHYPCSSCAGLLIQAGISRIVTRKPSGGLLERFQDSFAATRLMVRESGVTLVCLK